MDNPPTDARRKRGNGKKEIRMKRKVSTERLLLKIQIYQDSLEFSTSTSLCAAIPNVVRFLIEEEDVQLDTAIHE